MFFYRYLQGKKISDFEKILLNHKNHLNSGQYQGVIAACSGGVDSVVLTRLLNDVYGAQGLGLKIAIAHVNYGLRGEDSNGDEQFVRQLAKELEIPAHVKIITEDEKHQPGESLQEWARRLRYTFFKTFTDKGWIVALAHHLDDRVETMFLRMARGSHPSHWCAMDEWEPPYFRPLLPVSKEQILTYAKRRRIDFRTDVTNLESKYDRNKIRLKVIPLLEEMYPGASQRIANSLVEIKEITDKRRGEFQAKARKFVDNNGALKLSFFQDSSHDFTIKEALGYFLSYMTEDVADLNLSQQKLDQVAELVHEATPNSHWTFDLSNERMLELRSGVLRVVSTKGKPSKVKRAAQYDRLLNYFDQTMIIPARAQFQWQTPQGDFSVLGGKKNTEIRVFSGKSNEKYRWLNKTHSMDMKSLFQQLNIPPDERAQYLSVQIDENIHYLLSCGTLFCIDFAQSQLRRIPDNQVALG